MVRAASFVTSLNNAASVRYDDNVKSLFSLSGTVTTASYRTIMLGLFYGHFSIEVPAQNLVTELRERNNYVLMLSVKSCLLTGHSNCRNKQYLKNFQESC